MIDFSKASPKIKRYFRDYIGDLNTFFMYLFTETGVNLPQGRSLIVFDEVQRFPRAREAIKHLVKDGRYHYRCREAGHSCALPFRHPQGRRDASIQNPFRVRRDSR